MSRVVAIKTYFEADGGRKVKAKELMALKHDERTELARMACEELGTTLKV